jgi:hypothetical protein
MSARLPHVTRVEPLPGYQLRLTFDDGLTGTADLSELAGKGVFQALREPGFFAQAHIRDGTVTWPGGLDLDPEGLHEMASENPEPEGPA